MINAVYALLFLGCMGGFYALMYTLNHKTPVPAGCEDLKANCDGCKITSCGNHPVHDEIKGED